MRELKVNDLKVPNAVHGASLVCARNGNFLSIDALPKFFLGGGGGGGEGESCIVITFQRIFFT